MLKKLLYIAISLLFTLKQIYTHMTINNPQELSKLFNGHIKATYSNFGKVPYGQFVIGRLYYDPTDKELDYACKPLSGISIQPETRVDRSPIVMVDRGSCTFVNKVRNVQKLGGALALIVDNIDEDINKVIMNDDGTGSDIYIPAIMISKQDGQIIKDFFLKNKDDNQLLSSIVVAVEFQITLSERVNYNIFFSSANKKIYRLLKEFYPYYLLIKDYADFTPHYISHQSALYNERNGVQIEHCLTNGKYCASPRYDLGVQNGKDILLEDIRQKCLYNLSFNKTDDDSLTYMKYIQGFFDRCIDLPNPKFNYQCAYETLDFIGYDVDKVKDCIVQSFNVDKENALMFRNENKLLEQDSEVKSQWKVKLFPTIMVNNKTINGAWTAENLFEAICAGFINKPSSCKMYFTPSTEEDSRSEDFSAGVILFLIILIILLNITIIYVCKRYIIKKIHERVDNVDINGRINNVVTSYLALRDTK